MIKKVLGVVGAVLASALLAIRVGAQTLPTWSSADTASTTEPLISAFKTNILWFLTNIGPWFVGLLILFGVIAFFRRKSHKITRSL